MPVRLQVLDLRALVDFGTPDTAGVVLYARVVPTCLALTRPRASLVSINNNKYLFLPDRSLW